MLGRLTVVIPCYNEADYIADTLHALGRQTDADFNIVVVDNGSTDGTAAVVRCFADDHPAMRITCITEAQKGTGAAADTGFRYAIAQGATHIARTDADCLPRADWVANLKRAFGGGMLFVGGVIRPRSDEAALSAFDRAFIPFLLLLADVTGWLRRHGPENHYPYVMIAGNNLAITAALYEQAGGFPRSCIEMTHEDRVLSEAVRKLTPHGGRVRDVVVYNSLRRVRAYGYWNTILWYWDHHYTPQQVDVR